MNGAALLRTYGGVDDDDGAIALFLSPKLSPLLTDYKVLWSIWNLLPRTSLRNLLFSMHPVVSELSYGVAACLVKEFF